jgi:hypothetical protein
MILSHDYDVMLPLLLTITSRLYQLTGITVSILAS